MVLGREGPFLARLHFSAEQLLLYGTPGVRVRVRVRVRVHKQNVRANVKVMEFQSLCTFSCILTFLMYFAVAEGWLLLDIGWFVFFL